MLSSLSVGCQITCGKDAKSLSITCKTCHLSFLCKQTVNVRKIPLKLQRRFTSPGGGVLPSKRLLGMCRWMGSHFHNWTDYNGVTFLVELLEWGHKFSGLENSGKQGFKNRKIRG